MQHLHFFIKYLKITAFGEIFLEPARRRLQISHGTLMVYALLFLCYLFDVQRDFTVVVHLGGISALILWLSYRLSVNEM